ncbi:MULTISPECIES: site-specific integrase [unclassified Pseudomonas]|uniref:site-specific integrase n=1 Tax=unclassified Pseudomonas TaxID=196821 RepID=UPI0010329146|nr:MULTISPECIES: site-specific integrase [unclassified Pseudomonas]
MKVSRFLPVRSRLGYDVELFTPDGDFKPVIIVPDDTTQFVYLKTDGFNQLADDLKEILICYVQYIVQRYHAATLLEKFWFLQRFVSQVNAGITVEHVLTKLAVQADSSRKMHWIACAKEFANFLLLHEYELLSAEGYENITQLHGYFRRPNAYSALFLMDEEHGPFTREEVSVLSAEVDNTRHSLPLRLLVDLCLSHGLRPIQLSLLKRQDFLTDPQTGVRYLNVPRVKNGAQHRRTQFSARILSERTATLIDQVIASVELVAQDIPLQELPLFMATQPLRLERVRNAHGSVLWREELRRSGDYFAADNKQAYAYHRRASLLRSMLSYAQIHFPLSPRTGRHFNLHPYRFRYTIGTQAVMSGCSPEEVADLLDHSNTLCIKHYFRFTQEMWEVLEQATQSRVEQRHFTAAWMRTEDLKGNLYARPIYEPRSFTAIGQCATDSACFDEPAVACYACKRFCPNKDVHAHRMALEQLTQRQAQLLSVSTATVVSAFEPSIAGCQAAIAYAQGHCVTLIHKQEE